MINGIDEKWLSQKSGNVKVFHFSDARIEDFNHYIVPVIKNKPGYLILQMTLQQTHPEKLCTIY